LEGGFFERNIMPKNELPRESLEEKLTSLKKQKDFRDEQKRIEVEKLKNNEKQIKQQKEKERKVFFEKVLNNVNPILRVAIESCELKDPKIEMQEMTGRLYLRWDKYLESHDDGRGETVEYRHSISLQTEIFQNEFSFDDSRWKEKFENWLIEQLSKELEF